MKTKYEDTFIPPIGFEGFSCDYEGYCIKAREKVFEDLTCEELDNLFIKKGKYCEKYEFLFVCFSSWEHNEYFKDKLDIIKRMMELSCFKGV